MSRVELRLERCKGCQLCTLVCPKELLVLSDQFNPMGYKVVQFLEDKKEDCTGCGFCAEICPDNVITVFRSNEKKRGDKNEG